MAALNVDDCTALSLHEQILAHHYGDLAETCKQHETLKPLESGFRGLADQHEAAATTYRYIGQRIVDQETIRRMKANFEKMEEKKVKTVKRPNSIVILVFLLVMFLLAGGTVAWAQNATAEATTAPDATLAPGAPGQIEAPPDEALNPAQEAGVLRQILVALGSYFAGIGTIVLAGPRILSSIRNDKALLTFGEYLYNSVPADRQTLITTVGTAAGDLNAIIKEVSDDQPVLSKARDVPLEQAAAFIDKLNEPPGLG